MHIILGVVALLLLWGFISVADSLIPASVTGNGRAVGMVILSAVLFAVVLLVLDAFVTPPSHPSLAYAPAKYRDLMNRKCMYRFTGGIDPKAPNAMYAAYCTALDSPDLPKEIAGKDIASPKSPADILNDYNIPYKVSYLHLGSHYADDPHDFYRPVLFYKDGTRPENSILRFWETKIVK